MACIKVSQKSGMGSVKQIVTLFEDLLNGKIDDIRVTRFGTVTIYSDRLVDLPEELKWKTKGVKYDPSNGKYWLPKKNVKKCFTLPRWEKV